MPDRPLIVRLLDIGGDKKLPYFEMRDELYSFMGLRGIRVLLRYPKILETQLMALLKLSAHHPGLRILVPVVTLADEMAEVRRYLNQCMARLRKSGVPFNERIPLGSMIEVPAAVILIEDILENSDFISIGTNDLIQYTMASARENAVLARYYEAGTDIVMGYIRSSVQKAKEKGIECDLCGETAADTSYTEQLLSLGLENFSVAPASIPLLKEKIHSLLEKAEVNK
jgi:phosphoenolpyruvate-protein kinase (PTS system EI component)